MVPYLRAQNNNQFKSFNPSSEEEICSFLLPAALPTTPRFAERLMALQTGRGWENCENT